MRVDFHPAVLRQLQRLTRPVFGAALRAIVDLADEPRPVGVKKLAGSRSDWRIRIGECRIIYAIDDDAQAVTVLLVAHRREAYR